MFFCDAAADDEMQQPLVPHIIIFFHICSNFQISSDYKTKPALSIMLTAEQRGKYYIVGKTFLLEKIFCRKNILCDPFYGHDYEGRLNYV